MTDGYIIAFNMPVVKPFYLLSTATYLSEREQLDIFPVVLQDSQIILDCRIETENWLNFTTRYRLNRMGKT